MGGGDRCSSHPRTDGVPMTSMIRNPRQRFYTYKHEVQLAPGQGVFFTAGKGYHAGPAHPVHAAPAPPTDTQLAQQQVSAAFDPVLKQTTAAYSQRGADQARAISGATDSLATLMAKYAPAARAAYTGAAAGQSAIDAELAATRQGQGAQAQAELAAKLAAIHADPATAARIGGQFGGDLAGEAQATAGRGAANLSMLLGEGAHAADYGAKLPAIAGAVGLQAASQAQGQVTSDLHAALSELEAKRPCCRRIGRLIRRR